MFDEQPSVENEYDLLEDDEVGKRTKMNYCVSFVQQSLLTPRFLKMKLRISQNGSNGEILYTFMA